MSLFVKLICLGANEFPFEITKLNTLHETELIVHLNDLDSLGKPFFDFRVKSRFHGFLRSSWIDELLQLKNIDLYEMDLVGIRPKTRYFWNVLFLEDCNFPISLEERKTHRARALKYKPGLFGVNYSRATLDFADLVLAEKEYLDCVEKFGKKEVDKFYLKRIRHRIIFEGVRSR